MLLDLIMPEMDGWQVQAELKRREETRDIPIVIFSAIAKKDEDASRADLVDGWVQKPFDDSSLVIALDQAITQHDGVAQVLIVEDDLDLAQVMTAMFRKHAIETFHARTGKEAIELSQRITPDLVVLDLVLPEGDGFAVVEWLRRHDRLRSTPLVVYTAMDLDEQDREHLKLGETQFLVKSRVAPDEFEIRVLELLRRII